jgi:hypothetical protein
MPPYELSPEKKSEMAISAQIEEAHELGRRLRDSMKTIDTLNNLGLTVASVAIAYGVARNEPVVFALLPAVLLLFILHAVQTFTELSMMGAQRAAIEETLKKELSKPVLISETVIAPLRMNAADLRMKQLMYLITLVGCSVWGIYEADQRLSVWVLAILCAYLFLGFFALGISVKTMLGAYEEAKAKAMSALFEEDMTGRQNQ